jgi:hypothetical protein
MIQKLWRGIESILGFHLGSRESFEQPHARIGGGETAKEKH